MSLLAKMLGKHAEKVLHSVQSFLIKIDPETATEAQIAEFSGQLDKASQELAKARAEYLKEKKEADTIQENFNKRLQAATYLEKQIVDASEADKPQLQASLETLVTMIEKMQPDVEREKQEAEEAHLLVDELTKFVEESALTLREARAQLQHAQTEMKRADLEQQRAEKRANQAEVLAGIKKDSGSINVALEVMQQKANESRIRADAATTRANLLKTTNIEQDDPYISAALAQVSGEAAPPTSVAERLAALQKK